MKMQTIAAAGSLLMLSLLSGVAHAQAPGAEEPAKKQKQFSVFALSDQSGTTVQDVSLDGATWGAGVQWRKKSEKGMLASGIDLAYQPIGTLESEVTIDDNGTLTDGTLRARNQYLTAHYVLRLSPFNGWFQPFAEGFAGGRAAVLNTEFATENATLDEKLKSENLDVPEWGATWNYGWGFGCRLRLAEGFYVLARYANISSGELDLVTDVSIDADGIVNTTIVPTAMPTSSVLAGISWDMGLKKAKRQAEN